MSHASGLFWATVIGAALGVVAGTIIQYLLTFLAQKDLRKRQRRALAKEMAYNRSLVDELLSESTNFRNAVNGRVFQTYFGYFHSGKGIFAQANASAGNGFLYDYFSIEEVRSLQKIVLALSANQETWINGEITRRRNTLINDPGRFDYGEAVQFVNFLEGQFREVGRMIDSLIPRLR